LQILGLIAQLGVVLATQRETGGTISVVLQAQVSSADQSLLTHRCPLQSSSNPLSSANPLELFSSWEWLLLFASEHGQS
jgi:hypothetical protein